MSVELVVFDMAGTTVYDGDAVNRCLQAALAGAGATVTRDEVNTVMGIAKPTAIRLLLERQEEQIGEVTPQEVETVYADFLARMLAYYRTDPEVRAIPGAEATLRSLQAAGVKVALDTGFSRPIADAVIARLGWQEAGLLNATVTSDEVARGRPHPDMIFRAMELTGVTEVSRVAKVGDTPSDLEEGSSAGCGWVVGVTEGSHTHEQLLASPHTHLIGSVAELPELLALNAVHSDEA